MVGTGLCEGFAPQNSRMFIARGQRLLQYRSVEPDTKLRSVELRHRILVWLAGLRFRRRGWTTAWHCAGASIMIWWGEFAHDDRKEPLSLLERTAYVWAARNTCAKCATRPFSCKLRSGRRTLPCRRPFAEDTRSALEPRPRRCWASTPTTSCGRPGLGRARSSVYAASALWPSSSGSAERKHVHMRHAS